MNPCAAMAHPIANATAATGVAIWSACPDDLTGATATVLASVLDESECLRHNRFLDASAQRQFLVAHALLRAALSAAYPVKPAEWRFARTPSGQPIISQPLRVTPPFFSLSHTQGLACCAISPSYRVGVDAERIQASLDLTDLSQHVLSPSEQGWWQRQPSAQRPHQFYRIWTLKESLLKAAGCGLAIEPASISFKLEEEQPAQLEYLPAALGRCDEWTFRLHSPTNAHICALAAQAQSPGLPEMDRHHLNLAELALLLGAS